MPRVAMATRRRHVNKMPCGRAKTQNVAKSKAEDMTTTENMSQVSPNVQVMYTTRTDRIIAVLDQTIRKTKVALSLPLLLRNGGAILKPFLRPEDLKIVLAGCSKYPVRDPKLSSENLSATMETYSPNDSMTKFPEPAERWQQALGDLWKISSSGVKCRHDPNLARALHTLETNPAVMTAVEENLTLLVNSSGKTLLDHLERLRSCVADRLKVGPAEALQREKDLREAWIQGNEAVGKLAELQKHLENQRHQLGAVVATKAREVAKLRADINNKRQQCQDEITRLVNASERAMVIDSRSSEHRCNQLNANLKTEKENLANLLAEHLKEEHELRTKKHKMETLLITWLQKFDTEIGDKQAEFEKLTEEYEAEQAEMNELQEKLQETEEEYQNLLAEKEQYEKEEEEELVYMLRSRWAARVIQRVWREYRIRKKMKKGKGREKGKKGKGKGKAKQPAEEKLKGKGK